MELAVRGSRYTGDKLLKKGFPFMGSVISCNEESFKKVNGYPNHYWGWGNEDVDLTLRILEKNVKIYTPKKGGILDMEVNENGKEIVVENKMSKLRMNESKDTNKKAKTLMYKNMMDKSGLKSLKYKVLNKKVEVKDTVVLYKVDLMKKGDLECLSNKKMTNVDSKYKNLRNLSVIDRVFI